MLKKFLWVLVIMLVQIPPARAQLDSHTVDERLSEANRSIREGRIKEGIDRFSSLLVLIDASKDQDNYFRVSTSFIEILDQIGNYSPASELFHQIVEIAKAKPPFLLAAQFCIGRMLYSTQKYDDAVKILVPVTGGNHRGVVVPLQRAAAVILSKIELERGNINQASIWMRRAVIGAFVDKGAGTAEIVDLLSEYAIYLGQTRQLADASRLFWKLYPIYNSNFSHRSPKFLTFLSNFTQMLSAVGKFAAADAIFNELKSDASEVDVVPGTVRNELYFNHLYVQSRSASADTRQALIERLKQVVLENPRYLDDPYSREQFTYFALFAHDIGLAEQFSEPSRNKQPTDPRSLAYDSALNSAIAALESKFAESTVMSEDAVDKIVRFHRQFENETSSRLPAITIEEGLVLNTILGLDASHAVTYEQANAIFKLGQFLNRDKVKLGLNESIARYDLKSDLQREDLRSRDVLKDLRDRLLIEAEDSLLARIFPLRDYKPSPHNDYAALIRLQDIEDKIQTADDNLRHVLSGREILQDRPLDLKNIQALLRPNEALVMHNGISEFGLVTTCVQSDRWTIKLRKLEKADIKQLDSDEKLLSAAVHNPNEPSADLDASTPNWPAESAYRLFDLFFGDVQDCLEGKTHILLATDADYFALPWNALLTSPSPRNRAFQFRTAPWLPKRFALSLLPSVRSFYELRSVLAHSGARHNFLGIGDPDLHGSRSGVEVALGPLFLSRGIASTEAIKELPALPETAEELKSVATILGSPDRDLLLGPHANERELRKRPLNDYRVISFATHAIVAGEIEGVTEPALVLSPIQDVSHPADDGLLTASKVANLTLDANLVILSACNTAASDGHASGRGLSGLANAFFFAGARSVAVTQWSVISSAAQQIGSGLVARSTGPESHGVSDGLRGAMLNYIETAGEDYLANPRFWAAYIIAGDGAVRPLDGVATDEVRSEAINLEWERIMPNPGDSELLSIAKGNRHKLFYSTGIEKPSSGEKPAGSYFAEISANTEIGTVIRDPGISGAKIASFGETMGYFGYVPRDNRSSALFRLLDSKGNLEWQHVEESPMWNLPLSMLKTSAGYVLISIEIDYSPNARPSTLATTLVSELGATLLQKRYAINISPGGLFSQKAVAIDEKGRFVVAIGGTKVVTPNQPTSTWINPLTGTIRLCSPAERTEIFEIDPQSLALEFDKVIDSVEIVSLQLSEGHLYASGQASKNCHLEKGIIFGELGSDFELRKIFESTNVNSIEVRDMGVASGGIFVLAGTTRTFLPSALMVKIVGADQLLKDAVNIWDESFWESSEQRGVAFALALTKNGSLLGDRVFTDLRDRDIAALIAEPSGGFIVVGNAFGDRGWIAGLRLRDHLSRDVP